MTAMTGMLGGTRREPEPTGQRPIPRLSYEGGAGLDVYGPRALAADGIPLLLAEVAGSQLAFRTARASRGDSLQDGDLNAMVRLPCCEADPGLGRANSAAGGEPLHDA